MDREFLRGADEQRGRAHGRRVRALCLDLEIRPDAEAIHAHERRGDGRGDREATSPATLAPADALTYCQNLGLNGHTFRLPSIKELSTLVDENPPITAVSPAIDKTMFPDTKANGWYLSSSKWAGPAASSSSGVWAINFEDGFTDPGYSNHFTDGWARCVR